MHRILTWLVVAVVLATCGSPPGQVATAELTPEAPAFDLAAVRASFTEECLDPIIVDDLFCGQVRIADMSADGNILNVPTTLNAAATDRAAEICNQLAFAHFDAETVDLGYEIIGILDQDGGNAAACSVS